MPSLFLLPSFLHSPAPTSRPSRLLPCSLPEQALLRGTLQERLSSLLLRVFQQSFCFRLQVFPHRSCSCPASPCSQQAPLSVRPVSEIPQSLAVLQLPCPCSSR